MPKVSKGAVAAALMGVVCLLLWLEVLELRGRIRRVDASSSRIEDALDRILDTLDVIRALDERLLRVEAWRDGIVK